MMRMLWRKTRRDLRRSWGQTLALITVVAVGITTFVASIGAYRDLGTSYRETYARLRFADVTFRVQAAPSRVVDEVAATESVRAASGRLVVDTGFLLPNGEPIRARLIGLPAATRPAVNDILILEGRYLRADDVAAAVVESHFAEFYNLHPGDTVTPLVNGRQVRLTVVGVAVSPEYLIVTPSRQELLPSARTFAVIFVPLSYLQRLVGMEDAVNDIGILVAPNADRDAVVDRVKAKLAPYGLVGVIPQEKQPSNEALHLDLEGFREIAFMMPGLILIVAAMSVYIMLGRLVRAQQGQIGVMKAIGYGNGAVLVHYLTFGLVIGLLGALVGVLLGVPLQRAVTALYTQELGIPIVKTRFYVDTLLVSVAASLLVVFFGSVGPARAAAGLPPAQAMRVDPASALVRGRRLFFERWVPLSTWLRLALRNVFRIRRRSFGTWLGVVFAFVLVLASWGLIDSMDVLLYRMFHVVERWDLLAAFNRPQGQSVLATVRNFEGVLNAEPAIQVPAQLQANGREQDILLTALTPGSVMHALQVEGNPAEVLSQGGLVTTPALLDKLGVSIGDRVMLKTPLGSRAYTIRAVTDEAFASVAYVSLEEFRTAFGLPAPVFNVVYVRVQEGQAAAVKKALYALPGVYSVQEKAGVQEDWQTLMGLYYAVMGILMLFAVIMALAVLFNAMTVNVLERQRELATMRALGAPNGRIAALILVEVSVIWLLALVPGLLLGTWVTNQMAKTFSTDLFYFKAVILKRSYLVTALGIFLVSWLACWPSIRYVNRLNLAEATKMIT